MSENNLAISIQSAVRLADAMYRRKPGNSATPLGEHWITRFQHCHKELWSKLSVRIDRVRTIATDMVFLEDYFAKLENIYAKYYIPDNAKYNLDEKGVMMGVAGRSKVLVKKGTQLHTVCQDTNREMVTMVVCICSDGTVAPPLMIFKGASHYYGWYSKEIEGSNYIFGYSPNGYIDHELLFLWLHDIFHPAPKSNIADQPEA